MQRPPRRAAYVQPRADYFGRAFDDGIIRALLEAGFAVDVFAPDGEQPQEVFDERVRRFAIEFRRGWLARNLASSRWRQYDLFLGNPDLGTAMAAMLARAAFRPFVNAVDEIYTGGYSGPALGYWRDAAAWGARRALFTIITDVCRIELQRQYASLRSDHRFIQIPACFTTPYSGPSKSEMRAQLGLPADAFIVSMTGALTEANGAQWLFDSIDALDARLLIQPGNRPDAVMESLIARLERAHYFPNRETYQRAAEITAASDVGTVFYLSPKAQFQLMGVSSQKLDTYLWLGIPVVAKRQPSFEFITRYGCGELIDDASQLKAAVDRIRANPAPYAEGARRAVEESIEPRRRMEALTAAFAALHSA